MKLSIIAALSVAAAALVMSKAAPIVAKASDVSPVEAKCSGFHCPRSNTSQKYASSQEKDTPVEAKSLKRPCGFLCSKS
ncbi:hypothetical protein BX616_011248 [Lobosporangium transversale]|nr:hypothetical protein BX616_011248 [Lobosporangium transversale]